MATSTLELGIVILPDELTTLEASRLSERVINAFNNTDLRVKPTINTPHISLYDMVAEEKQLGKITKLLQGIARSFQHFTISMDNHLTENQYYIFWNAASAKTCPLMNALLQEVLETLCPLRATKLLQQVADFYPYFPPELQMLTDQYGIPFGLPQISFNPHITVVYNTGINPLQPHSDDIKVINETIKNITPLRSCQFTANKLAIAELGYDGNILRIIEQFD